MNNVDEVDELTSRLQEATDEARTLSDTLDGTSFDGSSVDTEPLNNELSGATDEADSLQGELDSISNTTINPEINIDNVTKILGMNITFVTSAKTDEEGYALLREFGLPFKNAKKD